MFPSRIDKDKGLPKGLVVSWWSEESEKEPRRGRIHMQARQRVRAQSSKSIFPRRRGGVTHASRLGLRCIWNPHMGLGPVRQRLTFQPPSSISLLFVVLAFHLISQAYLRPRVCYFCASSTIFMARSRQNSPQDHPVFAPDGRPILFYLWGSNDEQLGWRLSPGQREELRNKITVSGSFCCVSRDALSRFTRRNTAGSYANTRRMRTLSS